MQHKLIHLPRKPRKPFLTQEQEPTVPAHANDEEQPPALLETQHPQTSLSTLLFLPSCSTLPLLGIGFADPLCCHGADVVLGVKVSLLYFPPIYNKHDVIDCDAVEKKEKSVTFHLCKHDLGLGLASLYSLPNRVSN